MSGARAGAALGPALADLLYCAIRPVLRAALFLHFRRVKIEGREHIPRAGPALLVANHPSTWTDVLLLEAELGRRLHFLAESSQFRPWPRAALIRAFGTLPIYRRGSVEDYAERNAETMRRCEDLFDRGEVVVIFPEGISRTDRSLMPLRRGAARLALSYAARAEAPWWFTLVPVGIRYTDRTAFRSDIAAAVGAPVGSAALHRRAVEQNGHAEEHLTERIARTLRFLANLEERERDGSALSVLESVAASQNGDGSAWDTRALSRSLLEIARHDPAGHRDLLRLARAHARARKALRVSDRALLEDPPTPGSSRAVSVLVALGAAPALVGGLIHALPAALAELAARHRGYLQSEIAFARIASGFLFLTMTYLGIGAALILTTTASPILVASVLAACALSGIAALPYRERARVAWERFRLWRIARCHPVLVERARASERTLAGWVPILVARPAGAPP